MNENRANIAHKNVTEGELRQQVSSCSFMLNSSFCGFFYGDEEMEEKRIFELEEALSAALEMWWEEWIKNGYKCTSMINGNRRRCKNRSLLMGDFSGMVRQRFVFGRDDKCSVHQRGGK